VSVQALVISRGSSIYTLIFQERPLFVQNMGADDSHKGVRQEGLRAYLFDDNCSELRKLVDKVDRAYEEIAREESGEKCKREWSNNRCIYLVV